MNLKIINIAKWAALGKSPLCSKMDKVDEKGYLAYYY